MVVGLFRQVGLFGVLCPGSSLTHFAVIAQVEYLTICVYSVYHFGMNSREVIARLKKEGWFLFHTRGSHQQFKHPTKPGKVTVPHPKKDLPKGTLRNIFRQADWDWDKR